jgi:hypothetical protein
MSATPALSAAPPNALTIWTDGRDLYLELPGPDRSPVLIRYPLTAIGLSSALGVIRTRARFDGQDLSSIPHPRGNHGTSAQYDNARATLRNLGVLR